MHKSNFDASGSSTLKRSRPDFQVLPDPADPAVSPTHLQADPGAAENASRTKKLRAFEAYASEDNDDAVSSEGGDDDGRHLCSAHNAAASGKYRLALMLKTFFLLPLRCSLLIAAICTCHCLSIICVVSLFL